MYTQTRSFFMITTFSFLKARAKSVKQMKMYFGFKKLLDNNSDIRELHKVFREIYSEMYSGRCSFVLKNPPHFMTHAELWNAEAGSTDVG